MENSKWTKGQNKIFNRLLLDTIVIKKKTSSSYSGSSLSECTCSRIEMLELAESLLCPTKKYKNLRKDHCHCGHGSLEKDRGSSSMSDNTEQSSWDLSQACSRGNKYASLLNHWDLWVICNYSKTSPYWPIMLVVPTISCPWTNLSWSLFLVKKLLLLAST